MDSTPLKGINNLPDPILIYAFHRIQQEEDDELGKHQAIVPISHVCQLWRSLATSTPSFWTKIWLSLRRIKLGLLFIERSEGEFVRVYLSSQGMEIEEDDITQLTSAIETSVYRWKHITVEEHEHRIMSLLVYLLFRDADWTQSQTTLKFVQHDRHELKAENSNILEKVFAEFHDFPRLTSVKMWRMPIIWATFNAPNLTVLDVRNIYGDFRPGYHSLRRVFKASPKLRHLVLINVKTDIQFHREYLKFSLPSLESLAIRLYNESGPINARFLQLIKAPDLKCLTVSDIGELSTFATQAFSSTPKPFLNLTSLSVFNTSLNLPIPEELYMSCPKLRNFALLQWDGWDDNLFRNLEVKASTGFIKIWPHLERITTNAPLFPEHNPLMKAVETRRAIGQDIQVSYDRVEPWFQGDYLLEMDKDLY